MFVIIVLKLADYSKISPGKFLAIEPNLIKFSGFEVGKMNILKVRIINTSQKPQRIHILPPITPYFQIRYDKKGTLASGMYEEVYIHFRPVDYM